MTVNFEEFGPTHDFFGYTPYTRAVLGVGQERSVDFFSGMTRAVDGITAHLPATGRMSCVVWAAANQVENPY
jgi:hypothetical protein